MCVEVASTLNTDFSAKKYGSVYWLVCFFRIHILQLTCYTFNFIDHLVNGQLVEGSTFFKKKYKLGGVFTDTSQDWRCITSLRAVGDGSAHPQFGVVGGG